MNGLLRHVVYTTAKKKVNGNVMPNGKRRVDFEDRHPVFAYVVFIAIVVAGVVLLAVM